MSKFKFCQDFEKSNLKIEFKNYVACRNLTAVMEIFKGIYI